MSVASSDGAAGVSPFAWPRTDLIASAERVASEAHAGQTDEAGRRYLDHPRRVAARVSSTTTEPDAVAAAWLHDVVEDTPVTLDRLRELGFSETVVEAVDALTRRPGEDDYFRPIATNDVARVVKLADLWDNTHPDRVSLLDPDDAERLRRKYRHAARLLSGAAGRHAAGEGGLGRGRRPPRWRSADRLGEASFCVVHPVGPSMAGGVGRARPGPASTSLRRSSWPFRARL